MEDGCEYIWQADAKYWGRHAPWLFPICSHLYEDTYTYRGKTYHMGLHGFARQSAFIAKQISEVALDMTLTASDQTREMYPFDFSLTITYSLDGNKLTVRADIKNTGDNVLCAGFGAHPGFNLPLSSGSFEDFYLEFPKASEPAQWIYGTREYMSMERTNGDYPIRFEEGKRIRLEHELFTPDGIFLKNMPREVTLRSEHDRRYVTVKYPDMSYVGFWQEYGADTPFLCIEPWCAPPDNIGYVCDLFERAELMHLGAGEERRVSYSIIFG
jgi:galactose mutarotase-like enzyme